MKLSRFNVNRVQCFSSVEWTDHLFDELREKIVRNEGRLVYTLSNVVLIKK